MLYPPTPLFWTGGGNDLVDSITPPPALYEQIVIDSGLVNVPDFGGEVSQESQKNETENRSDQQRQEADGKETTPSKVPSEGLVEPMEHHLSIPEYSEPRKESDNISVISEQSIVRSDEEEILLRSPAKQSSQAEAELQKLVRKQSLVDKSSNNKVEKTRPVALVTNVQRSESAKRQPKFIPISRVSLVPENNSWDEDATEAQPSQTSTSRPGSASRDQQPNNRPKPPTQVQGIPYLFYIESKREELERQKKKAESRKSKPRGPNYQYQWTLDDYVSGPSRENVEQARGYDEAWSGGPVSTQGTPLPTIPRVPKNIPFAPTYIERRDRVNRRVELSGLSNNMQQRLGPRGESSQDRIPRSQSKERRYQERTGRSKNLSDGNKKRRERSWDNERRDRGVREPSPRRRRVEQESGSRRSYREHGSDRNIQRDECESKCYNEKG